MTNSVLGTGTPTSAFSPVIGELRRFSSPQDVLAAIDDDLESTIALVSSGGTTFLSPILGRLGGIVALDGTLRSHLAIVSREFEVPCLVGVDLTSEVGNGTTVSVTANEDGTGTLSAVDQTAEATSGAGSAAPAAGDSSASVADQWWSYVRRVGDDIAVKDFDVAMTPEALDELIASEMTDEQLDQLVQHMGRAFKPEMTRRSAFTSELFPMLPYMSMSVIEDFHTYADRIRTIDAALPAEEIGRQLRRSAGRASPLWTWMVGYHYLCGRECLIHMGKISRSDHHDEIRTVVDFWRRLTLAQRGDGTMDNKDAGFSNRFLPAEEVTSLLGATSPLTVADAKAMKRLNATVSGYSFLSFTDSRVGIYDSGPYPVGDGRQAIVRDYLCLGPSVFGYPWMADLPSTDGLTLVLVFDPGDFASFEINDWGTTFTEPDQLLASVTDAVVLAQGSAGPRPVAASDLGDLMTDISKVHMQLYRTFAEMDRDERIMSATRMYCWGLKPFADLAGVTDQIDWSISGDTLALFPEPLGDDEKAAAIFGTALVANNMPGAFSPLS